MAYRLIGVDGNILSVMSTTASLLEKAGEKVVNQFREEFTERMKTQSYTELLGFCAEQLDAHEEEIKKIERKEALDDNQENVECHNCNTTIPADGAELIDGTWYCNHCVEHSDECAGCGKQLFHPNEGNSKGDGEWWCDHCWNERDLDNSDDD